MRVLILGSLMAGALSLPGFAAEPSFEALVRSSSVPYRGTLVINGATVVRVTHGAGDRKRQEIVEPLKLKGDLIVDNGKTLWHFSPRTHRIDLSPTRQWGERISERLRLLTRNYRLKLKGRDAVAGRPVHVVDLVSNHPNRGWQRLWLDQDHAVPLRVERHAPNGRLLERTEFREIDFPERLDPGEFHMELPNNAAVTTSVKLLASGRTLSEVRDQIPFEVRLPGFVPPGFEVLDLHLFESRGVKSLHWRLTDGLTTLSLFLTEREHHPEPPGARVVELVPGNRGLLLEQPDRRMLCWSDSALGYVIVGELTEGELIRVARSTLGAD